MLTPTAKAQVGRGELVELAFDPKKLPDGLAGVYRVISEHPLIAGARRIDEVQGGMRLAYRAEVEALGWKVVAEEAFGVATARPLRFPRSAIPAYPKAVNELLAIERAIERERATAAEKPGRAETNLHDDVLPRVKAIDASLVAEFHDALIDFYLDAGSEHYANRQAKEAVAAMSKGKGKGPSLDWLTRRCRQLIDKGFYSSLLADAAIAAAEKTGKAAGFELALDIADQLLRAELEPNEGILADLKKRAAATKAEAKLTAKLLEHTRNDLVLSFTKKKEVIAIRTAMLAAVDALPRAERVKTLAAMSEYARGDDGGLAQRAALWTILTARVKELPELEDSIVRLACKICENIKIGDSHDSAGMDEGFRAKVGQYLQKISREAFERQYAFWAEELDGYSDWARAWFFDTFLTMEELEEAHPALFKHPDIVRACTKGLLLGVKLAENKNEFLDKLLMFLELTEGRGARAADMVEVIVGLFVQDRGAEAKPVIEKLASEAKATLQEVLVGLATEAARRPGQSLGLVRLLGEYTKLTTKATRDQIRTILGGASIWPAFVDTALDTAVTLTPQEVVMDLAPLVKLTHRHDPIDLRIHGGATYLACGKLRYDSVLWVVRDGALIYSWPPPAAKGEDEDDDDRVGRLQTARFVELDGVLRLQYVIKPPGYSDDKPWKLVTCDVDGKHAVEQEIDIPKEVVFPQHAPWLVCLTKGQTIVRDATGATTLATYDVAEESHTMGRSHLAIAGTEATLVFGADPAAPAVVPRVVEGVYWDGTRSLAICKSGKVGGEIIALGGAVVQTQQVMTGLRQCGQCEEWHERYWRGTNLRGLPGDELLIRDEYKYQQLEDAGGGLRGRVDTDTGPEQDEFADLLIRDLDGDGFDEVYVFDQRRKRLTRVRDRAAGERATIAAARTTVDGLAPKPVGFLGTSAAALDAHVDDAIGRAPARERAALAAAGFAAVRALLQEVRTAIADVDAKYGTEPESFPARVRRERVKIAATELKRLHTTYFEGAYGKIEAYPFAQAVLAGSIDGYRSHWTRKETGHEDMGFMRRILSIHMDIARETNLAPVLRGRVLDLASQILDGCQAPTVWLGLTEKWHTEKELQGSKDKIKQVNKTKSVEPVADQLAKLADKWGFGPMRWAWADLDDDNAVGTARVGEVTISVPIRFYDFGSTNWKPPWMLGPWQEVLALRPRFLKMVGAPAAPAQVWPKAKAKAELLDDWFTPAEIESTRREIALLRGLPPDQTTTGRAANAEPIAEIAARFGVKEDTAAVLAAHIAQLAPDRDAIAAWAGVKRDAIGDHLKKLEKAGAVKKLDKALALAVPHEGLRYESDDDKIAVFYGVFWNRNWNPHMDSDHKEYRTKCARRFLEADIIRAYLQNV